MKKKKSKKPNLGRIPVAKGTIWFKDKSKYNRRRKHPEKPENE